MRERIEFLEGIGASVGIALARKKAKEALEQSENKYRSIFENAVEGIFQTTLEGRFISVNPAMARMHGYASPEELMMVDDIGSQMFVNPEEREQYGGTLHELGKVEGHERQTYKKDGTIIWTSVNAHAVKDTDGRVLYFEGTAEDITIRKKSEEDVRQMLEKMRKSLLGTIQVISLIVETRDPYTAGHQKRVALLSRAMSRELGLSDDVVNNIGMAATIHDIGKMSVPAEILSKPTRLTALEFSLIKAHPQSGYDILKEACLPYPVAEIVHEHHERLDGSGYPQGLRGDRILLEAKIISVADVVEAIASHRPYRPSLGIDAALDEIEKGKGIFYDGDAVEICTRLFREKGFSFE